MDEAKQRLQHYNCQGRIRVTSVSFGGGGDLPPPPTIPWKGVRNVISPPPPNLETSIKF